MRELVINGRFLCQHPTGVQRVAREFVGGLDRLLVRGAYPGLRVVLAVPADADLSSLRLERVHTEQLVGGRGYFWEQWVLPNRTGRAPLLCLGNAAPIMSLIGRRQVAVMLHDQSYRLFPRDYSPAYRLVHHIMGHFILRRAQPLVTVSRTEANQIVETNRGIKRAITVAPNGSRAGDEPANLVARGAAGRPFVLHVGGFSERKNVEGVFSTAVALAQLGIGFRLVGRPTARAEAFVASLDPALQSLITFLGYVGDEQLDELYRRAACLLYPSFYEASGLPPSEAMALGCPVVVSDLPVMRERCGSAALYCDPHDRQDITATVLTVLRDPALAASLSRRGIDQARQFTWENQARIVVQAMIGQGDNPDRRQDAETH